MDLILGVDAGNTKTIAFVARRDGSIIGYGRSGSGDIYNAAVGEEIPTLREAVDAALAVAGASTADLAAAGFNMAGADYPEDYAFIEAAVRRYGYGRAFTIVNDGIGPLWAGSPDGTGVAVTCGTGAATGARAADGRQWHSSFWQQTQGGHHLGNKTLKAVYNAELGITPPTALTERVLRFYGETDVERVLHRHTARGSGEGRSIRHLARLLLDAAHEGDTVAREIVCKHGSELGAMALVAARKVGIEHEPFTLVLAGGVLRHPTHILAEALISRVRAEAPDIQPIQSRFEPVVGALFMGMHLAGITPDEDVHARVTASLPPSTFFKSDEL